MSALADGTKSNDNAHTHANTLRHIRITVIPLIMLEQCDKFFSQNIVLRHQIIKIAKSRGDKPAHATARDDRKAHTPDNGCDRTNIHQKHLTNKKKGHDTSNDMP
jgi:hypothetical protein